MATYFIPASKFLLSNFSRSSELLSEIPSAVMTVSLCSFGTRYLKGRTHSRLLILVSPLGWGDKLCLWVQMSDSLRLVRLLAPNIESSTPALDAPTPFFTIGSITFISFHSVSEALGIFYPQIAFNLFYSMISSCFMLKIGMPRLKSC